MASDEPSALQGGAARWLGGLCAALLLGSCGALAWEQRGIDDEGIICFAAGRDLGFGFTMVNLEADRPLALNVAGPPCLSSSCSRNGQASCNVELRDHELVLTSRFRWEERTRGSCTDDCDVLAATCTSEPLPAGSYVLRHGTAQHSLTIPSQRSPSCLVSALRAPP